MSKFARSRKNCEKLDKSQFLLKLLTSSGKGGTRVSSKNCDFFKYCEKSEKSQFLLKLIKSSFTGCTRVPSKNCDFTNFSQYLDKLQFFLLRANLDISACMGTLHPRPICLFDFKNLDTGKQKLLPEFCLKEYTM